MLRKAVITEKSMKQADTGWYTFRVSKWSTKEAIAKWVKDKFGVDIEEVRTINVKGKVKWQRRARKTYKQQDLKKALVKVKKGQKIALFETANPPAGGEPEVQVTRADEELKIVKEKKGFLGPKVKIEKGSKQVVTQRKVIGGE